jgi:RNA recognition motif-containing protein
MGTKLFVGNLSYGTTSQDLEGHFRQIGEDDVGTGDHRSRVGTLAWIRVRGDGVDETLSAQSGSSMVRSFRVVRST